MQRNHDTGHSVATATRGFTVIEMAISLAISVLLITTILSMSVETSRFIAQADIETTVQTEAVRAFGRITEILRKSGRVEEEDATYPRVVDGGAALEFRILQDSDANGYAFTEGSGELEWDPTVYTLSMDDNGNLQVLAGDTIVYRLGRYVANPRFSTIIQDSSLHLKEIQVTFETRRPSDLGFDLVHSVKGSIFMRN